MKQDFLPSDSLEAYRAACKDMDDVYSLCSRYCGLPDAEYWTLLMIIEGAQSQRDISQLLHVSRQTINSACKQLMAKGLIHLEAIEGDQRAKRIVLTDAGRQFADERIGCIHRAEERVWAAMSAEEREALVGLMRKYNGLMRAQLSALPPWMPRSHTEDPT